jgi:hypothetical protein
MNPLEKEFAPYQESLELKELGFDEPCFGSWETDYVKLPTYTHSISGFYKNSNHPIGKVTAPTFSQAFRWFREKGYDVKVQKESAVLYFGFYWTGVAWITVGAGSYEEAELACLRKLIEIVKNKN